MGQWNLLDNEAYSIHAEGILAISKGSPEYVIAVLDSGLPNISHSLFQHLKPGYDFIANSEFSLDGDGRDANPEDPGPHICKCVLCNDSV